MNRLARFALVALVAGLLLLWAAPALGTPARAAPALTQVESQVVVQEDGRLRIRYRLTFVDDASRTQITEIGPFDPGHTGAEGHIEYDGGQAPVTLVPLGGERYRVEFPIQTEPGGTYTV
ncbi:MAG: hypothetical protein PVG11_10285, partial [Anaerolineae bacterium]